MASRGGMPGPYVGFTLLGFFGRGDVETGIRGGWQILFGIYTVAALIGVVIAWRGVPETHQRSRAQHGRARINPPPVSQIIPARSGRGSCPASCAS